MIVQFYDKAAWTCCEIDAAEGSSAQKVKMESGLRCNGRRTVMQLQADGDGKYKEARLPERTPFLQLAH